ncbi:MAG: DUF2155 domain-containing protein [Hyphomicrobiaceae bacterium]|nr:DUF2155 domain-containing protein [Hyphomicrobiaceae bacterium]
MTTCGACRRRSNAKALAVALLTALGGASSPAPAERLSNDVAVFAALDKVTATIKALEVPLNQTLEFGALKVTPRACYSRPPTERPKTTTFVEIDETSLDGTTKRLFSGWMFAESPGLNAVEHPVFDIWLTDCKEPRGGPAAVTARPSAGGEVPSDGEGPVEDSEASGEPEDLPRRRIQR